MTIAESISSVFSGTGKSTDDFPIRRRFVYRELKIARSELIRQDLNKNRMLDGSISQTIDCFILERVDAASCYGCESGIFILKSKDPLPELIQFDSGSAVTAITLMNGVKVNYMSFADWQNRKSRTVTLPGHFGYDIRDGHLFILGYEDIDELVVSVSGFFEDPEQIIKLNNAASDCSNEKGCLAIPDMEFVCPGHLLRRIIEITRSVVLRRLGIPSDDNNNAKSEVNAQTQTRNNQQRSV